MQAWCQSSQLWPSLCAFSEGFGALEFAERGDSVCADRQGGFFISGVAIWPLHGAYLPDYAARVCLRAALPGSVGESSRRESSSLVRRALWSWIFCGILRRRFEWSGLERWGCELIWRLLCGVVCSGARGGKMPDYGRPAEDLEGYLERSLAPYPPLDYGSTLLARDFSPGVSPPSGGRKLNGGIMRLRGYRGPTVNIRPPKWADTTFWIRAKNYPDAQFIANAVLYLTGPERHS